LLNIEMVVLIPEEEIPKGPDGKTLVGRWFSVDHTRGRQRLIFDRRPQNSTEEVLTDWMDLPLGCQLQHLSLDPHETVRGLGDDLACYSYALRHEPNWWRKNAIGRRLHGKDFGDYGAVPGRTYRACLRVVAMGDLNGVAIAQKVDEASFFSACCMRSHHVVRHSGVTPSGPTWELVYLDDHNVTQKVTKIKIVVHAAA
jgi:hypothetical protein